MMTRGGMGIVMMICGFCVRGASGEVSPFAGHPAAGELGRVFAAQASIADFQPSSITRRDYLPLMGGNIDYWKTQQNEGGAIIDPFTHGERQYSTPAFALAAALLVREGERADLLEPATRAMSWATTSLAARKAADSHGDFFTPLLIHARRLLKSKVSAQTLAGWDQSLKSLAPERVYNMSLKGMNWNIVSSSGELLRRQDGLVTPDQLERQMVYLDDRLAGDSKGSGVIYKTPDPFDLPIYKTPDPFDLPPPPLHSHDNKDSRPLRFALG